MQSSICKTKPLFKSPHYLTLILVFALVSPTESKAACSSPAGVEGQFQFITDYLYYCNGNHWTELAAGKDANCTVGELGIIRYAGGQLEYCGGSAGNYFWFVFETINSMGACGGAANGTFKYDFATKNPIHCAGGTWYKMRSHRRVYISLTATNGNMGGLTGADAICQADAATAGKGGTWVAWLSTSTVNAKDRLVDLGPWTYGATIIANNKADLIDGTLTNSISRRFDNSLIPDPILRPVQTRAAWVQGITAQIGPLVASVQSPKQKGNQVLLLLHGQTMGHPPVAQANASIASNSEVEED